MDPGNVRLPYETFNIIMVLTLMTLILFFVRAIKVIGSLLIERTHVLAGRIIVLRGIADKLFILTNMSKDHAAAVRSMSQPCPRAKLRCLYLPYVVHALNAEGNHIQIVIWTAYKSVFLPLLSFDACTLKDVFYQKEEFEQNTKFCPSKFKDLLHKKINVIIA